PPPDLDVDRRTRRRAVVCPRGRQPEPGRWQLETAACGITFSSEKVHASSAADLPDLTVDRPWRICRSPCGPAAGGAGDDVGRHGRRHTDAAADTAIGGPTGLARGRPDQRGIDRWPRGPGPGLA